MNDYCKYVIEIKLNKVQYSIRLYFTTFLGLSLSLSLCVCLSLSLCVCLSLSLSLSLSCKRSG